VTKIGPFDLDASEAADMLNAPLNPNGRPNSDVVRPLLDGRDLMTRSRDTWIIDFGVEMAEPDAAYYETPFKHVTEKVKAKRVTNSSGHAYTEPWWRLGRPRPVMRRALEGLSRYIATPLVAKHRVFVWVPVHVISDNVVIVIARQDDYFLGVLQSKVHVPWSRRVGSRHVARSRYTPTTAFETFPFPWPPGVESEDDPALETVAKAARELVQVRDRWLNPPDISKIDLKKRTLTNLYNQRPPWLANAHDRLDRAVLDAYGWPHDLTDDEILGRLLALNLERSTSMTGSSADA
jgi:type II restriction/modification system DNA methylase subunit YeeA